MPAADPENWDSDGDQVPDGHEADNGGDPMVFGSFPTDNDPPSEITGWPQLLDVSTQTAEYWLRFDEPVTYVLEYQRPGEPLLIRERHHPVEEDTIVLQDLRPSSKSGAEINQPIPAVQSQYTVTLKMKDLAMNPKTITVQQQPITDEALSPFLEATAPGLLEIPTNPIRISSLAMTTTVPSPAQLDCNISLQVERIHEALNGAALSQWNREGQRVVAQVLIDTGSGWEVAQPPQLRAPGFYFPSYTGGGLPANDSHFVISTLTNVNGIASVDFSVSGLQTGDKVRYNVYGIMEPLDPLGAANEFTFLSTGDWVLPQTEDDPTTASGIEWSLRGATAKF